MDKAEFIFANRRGLIDWAVRYFGINRDDAVDCYSNMMLSLLENEDVKTCNVSFLHTTYHNHVVNHLKVRRQLSTVRLNGHDVATSPSAVWQRTAVGSGSFLTYKQVRPVVRRLKPHDQLLMLLRFAFDMKYREIAAFLEQNINTTKSQIIKAQKQLRCLLFTT